MKEGGEGEEEEDVVEFALVKGNSGSGGFATEGIVLFDGEDDILDQMMIWCHASCRLFTRRK